jgi:hypothetical protein
VVIDRRSVVQGAIRVEHLPSVLGVVSAILGVVAAIINRRRIVELRYSIASGWNEAPRKPLTVGKRFKRLIISLVLAFGTMMLLGSVVGSAPYDDTKNTLGLIILVPFLVLCLMAAYQFVAIFVVLFLGLWR